MVMVTVMVMVMLDAWFFMEEIPPWSTQLQVSGAFLVRTCTKMSQTEF